MKSWNLMLVREAQHSKKSEDWFSADLLRRPGFQMQASVLLCITLLLE